MDDSPGRPRTASEEADVPCHLAVALDHSANDLRHNRVEDARAVLAKLKRRLDDYLVGKRAAVLRDEVLTKG